MSDKVITIGSGSYRLTPTPKGENCCGLCALFEYCWSYHDMPCLDFTNDKDWHFVKVEKGNRVI